MTLANRHLVVDNYATHKHPKGEVLAEARPPLPPPLHPTSASWVNQVERFFGLITGDAIRPGVAELNTAIEA